MITPSFMPRKMGKSPDAPDQRVLYSTPLQYLQNRPASVDLRPSFPTCSRSDLESYQSSSPCRFRCAGVRALDRSRENTAGPGRGLARSLESPFASSFRDRTSRPHTRRSAANRARRPREASQPRPSRHGRPTCADHLDTLANRGLRSSVSLITPAGGGE